jgi:hypothetical protein
MKPHGHDGGVQTLIVSLGWLVGIISHMSLLLLTDAALLCIHAAQTCDKTRVKLPRKHFNRDLYAYQEDSTTWGLHIETNGLTNDCRTVGRE